MIASGCQVGIKFIFSFFFSLYCTRLRSLGVRLFVCDLHVFSRRGLTDLHGHAFSYRVDMSVCARGVHCSHTIGVRYYVGLLAPTLNRHT